MTKKEMIKIIIDRENFEWEILTIMIQRLEKMQR